jgi:pilus assembly protein Flp/PilA
MGETRQAGRLSDAARGRPAGRLAARSLVTRFLKDAGGATAIEYGLIVALIFLAIITGVTAFAQKTNDTYHVIETQINSVL